MRQLAARAGCSPANLYHHFTSKYELFVSIIEEAMGLHLAGLEAARRRHRDPVAQLRFVLENHLRLHMERPEVRLLRQDFHPLRGKELERFIAERDRWYRPEGELSSQEIARRITDFLLDGFRGCGRDSGPGDG